MSDFLLEIDRRKRQTALPSELIARDMMQARIISAMFGSAAKHEIALKGGMAMRAYGSHRFTKDIDLQSDPKVPVRRIEAIVETAIKAATSAGILSNVVVTKPKITDSTQRFKVNGNIVGGGSHVQLTVEVSRRGMPPAKMISSIAYAPSEEGMKAIMVETYSPTAIAASKVDCLLNPNRAAVRDVFDLNHLVVTMRVDPPIEALRALGKDALVAGLQEIWPKLEVMTWEMAQNDLLPFIPKEAAAGLDEEAWMDMIVRTGETVEGWLRTALEQEENAERTMNSP